MMEFELNGMRSNTLHSKVRNMRAGFYVVMVKSHLELVEEQPLTCLVLVKIVVEVSCRVTKRVEPTKRVEQ